MNKLTQTDQVLTFWFKELTPKQWFTKDEELDQTISKRFSDLHQSASSGELFSWRKDPLGSLAEIIILDQFSRNIYRAKAQAFAFDGMALVLAQEAIAKKFDLDLTPQQRAFLYMPFMHSESLPIHDLAMDLYKQPGLELNYEFEIKHRDIIKSFGRYPHRNALLNRISTPEEIEFLKGPNSSF